MRRLFGNRSAPAPPPPETKTDDATASTANAPPGGAAAVSSSLTSSMLPFRGFSSSSSSGIAASSAGNETVTTRATSTGAAVAAVSSAAGRVGLPLRSVSASSSSSPGWGAFRRTPDASASGGNSSGGGTAIATSAFDQVQMERAVALAAHNFGEGVQSIVASAKAKQSSTGTSDEWKIALLKLLGQIPTLVEPPPPPPISPRDTSMTRGATPVPISKPQPPPKMDIDVLLQNSKCDKFVLRCVENELPPNLIHCLRLLRVLELQHANTGTTPPIVARQSEKPTESPAIAEEANAEDTNDSKEASSSTTTTGAPAEMMTPTMRTATVDIKPISKLATAKVTRLLCLLCTDSSVGEQLRPHLFGLLALSGASYPPTGVHVAAAASEVICQFAAHCLTRNLVWFVHDRKMMIHMTDDVKELSGMSISPVQANHAVVPMGLLGTEAEKSGLMVIALRTVVRMVHESLQFESVDLVKDFELAGGFEVVHYAILHATGVNGKGLMELIPQLICCPTELLVDADGEGDLRKLATNKRVFDILADLLTRSNPLLRRKRLELEELGSEKDKDVELQRFITMVCPENISELAILSIQTAATERIRIDRGDQATSLDVQYDLSSELLAVVLQLIAEHPDNFQILETRLHILTLSLLAFPCFGGHDLKVLVMKTLEFVLTAVESSNEVTPVNACVEIFFALCRSLLKGDTDDNAGLGEHRTKVLEFIADDANLMGATMEKILQFDDRVASLMVESGILTEHLDGFLLLVSRFIQAESSSLDAPALPPRETSVDKTYAIVCRVLKLIVADQPASFSQDTEESLKTQEKTSIHVILSLAVRGLGIEAVVDAAGVFEVYMAAFFSDEGLEEDMRFVLEILEKLTTCIKENGNDNSLLRRVTVVVSMLRNVLETKGRSRDPFRECGGFDLVLRIMLSMKGVSSSDDWPDLASVVSELIQSVVGLLDAAIGMKSKNLLTANETCPLSIRADVSVDWVSSQLSSGSASSLNRNYIRQSGFYLTFAATIAATGLLSSDGALAVIDLAFGHMDPEFSLSGAATDVPIIQNPDAVRLALGIALYVPKTDTNALSAQIMDRVLGLCESDQMASTLSQLAGCGLSYSITNPKEFGAVLFDSEHHLTSQFSSLLCRVASFNMSYMDFTGILRNVAGPLLPVDGSDGRVRLPVISSSIKSRPAVSLLPSELWTDDFKVREQDLSKRLQSICSIAKNSERFERIKVGGDTINTIAVLMHKVRLEERLKAVAEEGRLKYIEVEGVDGSASAPDIGSGGGSSTPSPIDKVWSPLVGSGFTFSIWLRHEIVVGSTGNLYLLDICHLSNIASTASSNGSSFLSVWYDLQNQRFNVISSASYRGEPTCFPVSPLQPFDWHHVLITYTPAKRGMIARKSIFSLFVDGRPLEADVRVESVNLPPNSRIVIGAPNPALALSGVVRGALSEFEVGPMLLLSTILLDLDSTALFTYGPSFPGLLWGDRPQRLSLAATGTALFSLLANNGEAGSIASALRRRDVLKLETAGYSSMSHTEKDELSSMGLLVSVPPECVLFAFRAGAVLGKMRNEVLKKDRRIDSERLVNFARLNHGSDNTSTDAVVYGRGSVVAPLSFQDCLRWAGGPSLLMPLVSVANTPATLALSLQLVRLGCKSHIPNLESLQAGGGYRVLSVLLQGKGVVDEKCLDQCLAFSIHGFDPDPTDEISEDISSAVPRVISSIKSSGSIGWVFSDLDAMKHLLLNHQVWDLEKFGPRVPLRMLAMLNRLVDYRAVHKAFNARRLHQVGIVRWAIHLAIEAAELFSAGVLRTEQGEECSPDVPDPWLCDCPHVADVSVGGDPGNPFLLECKNLLRRVLTFMLTPGDLEALVESIVFTESINASRTKIQFPGSEMRFSIDDRMHPGPTMRLHFVRLLEELIVDGVNEIVSVGKSDAGKRDDPIPPHAGGVASPNQPYFTSANARQKQQGEHPKHQQAQNFLSAFASYLTPVWFATVLEGCHEEASASALMRLLILMLQGSSSFETAFRNSGAFSPFILSVPKYSTCPGIAITMLSQLLNVPILHLHSLPSLDPEQLCEVFDAEGGDDPGFLLNNSQSGSSRGIFSLIVECLGRNVQHITTKSELAHKAATTNQAIVKLLSHRHSTSPTFRDYCCTTDFLEPLSQALCLIYDEKIQQVRPSRSLRPSVLSDVPKDLTPTERFVGSTDDTDGTGMGIVRLIRLILWDAMTTKHRTALTVTTILRSFPIHASPQQVEAFHLVVMEHCCAAIDYVLLASEGSPLSLANCLGVCSVFLDHILCGLFSSEAALQALTTCMSTLNALLRFDTPAIYSLSNSDHSMLTKDAVYLASLICVTSLRMSLPFNSEDAGDEDLQAAVLTAMDANMESLLLLQSGDRKSNWKVPSSKVSKPSQNSKQFDLWESSSVARCSTDRSTLFPDSFAVNNPDVVATAPLLVSFHKLLLGSRDDIRSLVISILVSLLQHRSNLLSDLLVAEVAKRGRVETIDVVNRGGFKALLAAHEAASVADRKGPTSGSVKRKYASFFEWFEREQEDVRLVFDEVNKKANDVFQSLEHAPISHVEAVETEQKLMLVKLSSRSVDRAALGGMERAELVRLCSESTNEIHSQWKRQGFDDLAYGAMKWKVLLRQLKGSTSIWEGGSTLQSIALRDRLSLLDSDDSNLSQSFSPEYVKRWKLDLTESYERQRRRFLPNYEFHGLYNLDEANDAVTVSDTPDSLHGGEDSFNSESKTAEDFLVGGQVEATAAILKDLNIKRSHRIYQDEDESEVDNTADTATVATTVSIGSTDVAAGGKDGDSTQVASHDGNVIDAATRDDDDKNSSSYELITGLLKAGDWPEKSYNVNRCTGLEVTKALFLWCGNAIYVIDGFEQTGGDDMEGKITRVERERSSFYISLRQKDSKVNDEKSDDKVKAGNRSNGRDISSMQRVQKTSSQTQFDEADEMIYEHRSQRVLLTELHSVYRRRYQLQQNGLEFYDVHKNSVLIAFATQVDREEVLTKVLQSSIPNSVFSSGYGTYINYTKFMKNLQAKITAQWQSGKISNFEFLMQLNSLAGRSFNDLTQYPVFPWVIADYESEELDLNDPKSFRDLSKPMGALGEERAQQFIDRYEALASTSFSEDDPPPFHYGTHYSCAAYVLYYLMRLEPFSRLALSLQGGRFDVADRLFHDVGRSWKSASSENLQDVRELIPEFFYLPDFLVNTNDFDFGETQRGKSVHDVSLPKWAKGDPKRFVRMNRQALESEYVSKNLHHWIDLVFGCKQIGEKAVESLNVFVHVTYEGEVDIDAMTDPIQKQSTIAQIQNFGQTPSRLERWPFPQRVVSKVLKDKSIDFGALSSLVPSTPPLCVVGAPHRVHVKFFQSDTCKLGVIGQSDKSVGEMSFSKGQAIAVGKMCALINASKKYFRFGGLNNGLSIHAAAITTRFRETNKLLSMHDDLHRAPISTAKASLNGNWLVTGSVDSTLRVWAYDGTVLNLRATLCGHDGSHIKCIDVSTECGVIASGCGQGRVLLWDLRTMTYVRQLRHPTLEGSPVLSVAINHRTGNIVTLVGTLLCVFDVNGNLLAQQDAAVVAASATIPSPTAAKSNKMIPTCAAATDCPEWMEEGVVAVTGHFGGEVRLWSLRADHNELILRHCVEGNPHTSPITSLCVTGADRQDTLLIGDATGRISVCKTVQLDSYSADELALITSELATEKKTTFAEAKS